MDRIVDHDIVLRLIIRHYWLKFRNFIAVLIFYTLPLRRSIAVDIDGVVTYSLFLIKQGPRATGNFLNFVMDASETNADCTSLEAQLTQSIKSLHRVLRAVALIPFVVNLGGTGSASLVAR